MENERWTFSQNPRTEEKATTWRLWNIDCCCRPKVVIEMAEQVGRADGCMFICKARVVVRCLCPFSKCCALFVWYGHEGARLKGSVAHFGGAPCRTKSLGDRIVIGHYVLSAKTVGHQTWTEHEKLEKKSMVLYKTWNVEEEIHFFLTKHENLKKKSVVLNKTWKVKEEIHGFVQNMNSWSSLWFWTKHENWKKKSMVLYKT